MIISFIKEALSLAKKRRSDDLDRKERCQIAKAFNDRYTYRKEWIDGADYLPGVGAFGFKVRGGYAWMCPECNKIHHPVKMSPLTGLVYPACCSWPEMHRLTEDIRAD